MLNTYDPILFVSIIFKLPFMSTATLDIEKIDSTLSSFEDTEKTIIEGSDAHLDIILEIQKGLTENTELTRSLVDYIEANFNCFSETSAQMLVAKIFPCFDLTKKIREAIESVNLINEVRGHLSNFEAEVDELFEITTDLSRYKVNGTDEFNSLITK